MANSGVYPPPRPALLSRSYSTRVRRPRLVISMRRILWGVDVRRIQKSHAELIPYSRVVSWSYLYSMSGRRWLSESGSCLGERFERCGTLPDSDLVRYYM